MLLLAAPVGAQTWSVQAGGELATVEATAETAASESLRVLREAGYLYARVDSLRAPVVFVSPGPLVRLGEIVVTADSLPVARYRAVLGVEPGDPSNSRGLEDAVFAAEALARGEGFADPRVMVEFVPLDSATARVTVDVREGERLPLTGVVLRGSERATNAFALRASGLVSGQPPTDFDPERVRQSLIDSGAFVAVGTPTLALDQDGALVVEVPVSEGPPGAVDAILGYLPPSAGRSGEVVGTARVDLASPFGGGRVLALALDRSPGLASRFSASAADPFVFGLPVSAALGFEGEGRDSTFSRQSGRAEAGIRVAPGLTVAVTASREAVQPGRAGARVGESGAPRVRRSSAWFGGLALRYVSVDSRRSPSRGVLLSTSAEQGVRSREALDDLAIPTRLSQQRLDASARVFIPAVGRLVAVVGGDARVLLTDRSETTETTRYDEGELFRFGGAASLRGYDEDTFLGNAVGRVLGEMRARLGGDAFAFAFGDLGAVRRPPLADDPAETRLLPGYGIGAQLETGLGLVGVTYALNPDLPASRGKVHLRLRLGL